MSKDRELFDFILTQTVIGQQMPYEIIEEQIDKIISNLKNNNLNARIANVALNINGQLVLAQIYVERKNGFVPSDSKSPQFGTSPTCYNVQIRFPFGLNMPLGQKEIFLPIGDFDKPLMPYMGEHAVKDDVRRDYEASDIICGSGVMKDIEECGTITLSLDEEHSDESIKFTLGNDIGLGYELFGMSFGTNKQYEYKVLEDYDNRLKVAGVYPLFYSSPSFEKQGLLRRHDYKGYTEHQTRQHTIELNDHDVGARLKAYDEKLARLNEEITANAPGQRWLANLAHPENNKPYVFDLTIINGEKIRTQSGLPLTRLRNYQLDLFSRCLDFLEETEAQNEQGQQGLARTVNMGVGAGKTYFTFTLLQHLKSKIKQQNKEGGSAHYNPPFCVAPDEAVAEVTVNSIKNQGCSTGTSAIPICSNNQMPNLDFLKRYEAIANQAEQDAKTIDAYIQHGLQEEILNFCSENNIHLLKYINLIYSKGQLDLLAKFKESIDAKRLILMVEGQKTILEKTNMLGIDGLKNLLDQFTTLKKGMEAEPMFSKMEPFPELPNVSINYNQEVTLPNSVVEATGSGKLNLCDLSDVTLKNIVNLRYKTSLWSRREMLLRLACMKDTQAAVILSNSGGLGNTYTNKELEKQIERLLPIAAKQVRDLARKEGKTIHDHYTMYVYLNELFSTIPNDINLKEKVGDIEEFELALSKPTLEDQKNLVVHIQQCISDKLKQLTSVNTVVSPSDLENLGISGGVSCIEAANQLAGIAALQLTGHVEGENAALLLSHIPVFTPEGFVAYFEYLASLEGQPKANFQAEKGVYKVKADRGATVTKKDIQDRINQILHSVMIADEVHKEQFAFLYDKKNELHQRLDTVTRQFLGQPFCQVLPHRIGMSGTLNEVAEKAFGSQVLYELSIPKMMQEGLMKHPGFSSQTMPLELDKSDYAKQVVIDYFTPDTAVSLNVLTCGDCVDLYQISKGLIFSKNKDEEVNERIVYYFNLLFKNGLTEEEADLQKALLDEINKARENQVKLLNQKLAGNALLTDYELANINKYNETAERKIEVQDKKLKPNQPIQISVEELSSSNLQLQHDNAVHNNLFALYLDFLFSKSSSRKEFSDVIGLQNKLYEKGISLIEGFIRFDPLLSQSVDLINGINTQLITEEAVRKYLNTRIKNEGLIDAMTSAMMLAKNKPDVFIKALQREMRNVPLVKFITEDRDEFESGLCMAMLGTDRERTGYSHEPVGIVMDVPSASTIQTADQYLEKLQSKSMDAEDVAGLLEALQSLASETFDYDEKNQAGGRALRTPYGHVKYVEYQTTLPAFIASQESPEWQEAWSILKLETPFQSIFTEDEQLAKKERASISFNRTALSYLQEESEDINAFYKQIRTHFLSALKREETAELYENFIQYRLPLLWCMKHRPQLVIAYLNNNDNQVFEEITAHLDRELQTPDEEIVVSKNNSNERPIPEDESESEEEDINPVHEDAGIDEFRLRLSTKIDAYIQSRQNGQGNLTLMSSIFRNNRLTRKKLNSAVFFKDSIGTESNLEQIKTLITTLDMDNRNAEKDAGKKYSFFTKSHLNRTVLEMSTMVDDYERKQANNG